MMKTNNNKTYTYNDEFLSNKEKNDFRFGKKIAHMIYNEWWGGNQYRSRKNWINEMRKFASGTHDMDFFKKWLCGKGNQEIYDKYFNVDFKTRLKILPTLLNIIKNNIDETYFEPRCFAIDPVSNEKKTKLRDSKIALMSAQNMLKQAKEIVGVDLIGQQEIPQSVQEIDLDIQLNYKSKVEQSEELLISTVLNDNYFKEIVKPRVNEDLVDIGIGVTRCYIDNIKGLVIKYVDPENWGHSFTSDPFFRDCNYFFEKMDISIAELKNQTSEAIDVEELKKALSWNSPSRLDDNKLENTKIPVIAFCYKTSHTNIFKKKKNKYGSFSMIDKTETGYTPVTESASEKIEDAYDVWYEGLFIIQPNYQKLVKWELMENVPEYKGEILPPYVAVAPKIRKNKYFSLLNNAIPTFRDLQRLDLKIQQLESELRPNTIVLSQSILTGIDIAGKHYTGDELLALRFGKGIEIDTETDDNGNPTRNLPINERQTIPNPSLTIAVNQYVQKLAILKNILGQNDYTDASTPNPKTLVGVMELVRLSSNTATRHIVDSSLMISLNNCQVISSRLNDVFRYSDKLKERYINKVSSEDITVIEDLKERDIHYFGVYMDYVPTQKERMDLEADMDIALREGSIDISVRTTIRRIKNIRLAEQILKQEIRKYRNRIQQEKKDNIDYNANANAQAAQAAEEERRKTSTLQNQEKAELMQLEFYYKESLSEAETQRQLLLNRETLQGKVIIEQVKQGSDFDIAKYIKDREEQTKLKTIDRSALRQSELIDQRKFGTPPATYLQPTDNTQN